MSVAYAYYKYLITVSVWYKYYCTGKPDVLLILDETPIHWDDMAASEKGANQSDLTHDISIEASAEEKIDVKFQAAEDRKKTRPKCMRCLKVFFVVLGVIGVVAAVALIILAVLTSIATKAYDSEQSNRMVAMVLLAVSAAVTICDIIYGEVALFKQSRSVHMAAMVLLLLAIVQALIAGISVNVEPADEAKLLKSLAESFRQAREENPRHLKIWAMTQSDLNCCGVYSPEDYRSSKLPYYFPPNVPISCCISYDSSRSDLVQERDRELCKVKKTYFTGGCKDLVLMVFKETSSIVFTVAVLLIVVEVLLIIIGGVLCRRKIQKEDESSK